MHACSMLVNVEQTRVYNHLESLLCYYVNHVAISLSAILRFLSLVVFLTLVYKFIPFMCSWWRANISERTITKFFILLMSTNLQNHSVATR